MPQAGTLLKVGDLIRFRSGKIAAIIELSPDFGGYALVWISGRVLFPNPAPMNMASLKRCAKVIR